MRDGSRIGKTGDNHVTTTTAAQTVPESAGEGRNTTNSGRMQHRFFRLTRQLAGGAEGLIKCVTWSTDCFDSQKKISPYFTYMLPVFLSVDTRNAAKMTNAIERRVQTEKRANARAGGRH